MGSSKVEKLVVTPGWLAARSAAGDLHLVSLTGVRKGLRVPSASTVCQQVLELADGTLTADGVVSRFDVSRRETASRLVRQLRAYGVLGIASDTYRDAPEQRRFIRQIEYFEDLTADQGSALRAQRTIAQGRAAIIGIGGVGSWVLTNLAMVGVRRFVLVDPDRVEVSNLSRQIIFRDSDQGKQKVTAAARWLSAFEPEIEVKAIAKPVHTAADLEALLPPVDVVIRTAGYVPSPLGREVNRFCLDHRCAYLSVGGSSWGPLVGGPLAQTDDGCFGCFEQILSTTSESRFGALSAFRRRVRETHSPVFGPVIGTTVAAAMGDFVLDHAGLARSQARGAVITISMFRSTQRIPVARQPACPDCGNYA